MITLIIAIMTLNMMVFFHELGHLITAKLTGMKVREFAIGFWKRLYSFHFHGTEYSIRLIPLGGFNDIKELETEGIDNRNKEKETTTETGYQNGRNLKRYLKRILVLSAGSLFNFLTAYLVILLFLMAVGLPIIGNTIDTVMEGHAAYSYIQPQDKIIKIGDRELASGMPNPDGLNEYIRDLENPLVTVERNGTPLTFTIEKEAGELLGIKFQQEYQSISLGQAIYKSNIAFVNCTNLIIKGVDMIINSPEVKATESISGPIGVTSIMYDVTEAHGYLGLGYLFVILSINLGMFNLLPIPLFDGGHIALETFQFIIGRRLKEVQLKYINYAGLAVIVCIFVFGTYSDMLRIFNK